MPETALRTKHGHRAYAFTLYTLQLYCVAVGLSHMVLRVVAVGLYDIANSLPQ